MKKDNVTIYTRETASAIIDLFEDLLDEHNIKIPNEDRDNVDVNNEELSPIYGKMYDDLLNDIEHIILADWKLAQKTLKPKLLSSGSLIIKSGVWETDEEEENE